MTVSRIFESSGLIPYSFKRPQPYIVTEADTAVERIFGPARQLQTNFQAASQIHALLYLINIRSAIHTFAWRIRESIRGCTFILE